MKAQKFYDRDRFTYDEKAAICKKSDNQCCHCGRKVFINYGATIDHFIPLSHGGSNNHINLIMLCETCNHEKDDKILNIDYVPYLKDSHKEKLAQYVDSYIHVMDLAERNRLLAYDEYTQSIEKEVPSHLRGKSKYLPISKYKLKLATWNDLDKLCTYLVKYLKKYDSLDDEEAARENIIFWMQFGSIYYVEKNNEINMMAAITIKHVAKEEGFRGCDCIPYMYIFPYYTTDISCSIVYNLITNIPSYIIEEAKLDYVPLNVLMLASDKMTNRIAAIHNNAHSDIVSGFISMNYIIGNVNTKNEFLEVDQLNESELKTYKFFRKFDDVTNSMIDYFKKYPDRERVSWMINSIFSYEKVKDTDLMQFYEDFLVYEEE